MSAEEYVKSVFTEAYWRGKQSNEFEVYNQFGVIGKGVTKGKAWSNAKYNIVKLKEAIAVIENNSNP